MSYPRLTIDLDTIAAFTARLSERLLHDGYTLLGVTKAVDGEPAVGQVMLEAGCTGLADARLPALTRLSAAGLAPLTLLRAPVRREIAAAATVADRVVLSDIETAALLGRCSDSPLEVLLAVDFGDRREGILPAHVEGVAGELARLPGVQLAGLSITFGCLCGQLPSVRLIQHAEQLLERIADRCMGEPVLSLGGTCVIEYLDGYRPAFTTEIRCGSGLLFGYDFIGGGPLDGATRSDPLLTAEVLECYRKPPPPSLSVGGSACGHVSEVDLPAADAYYSLLNVGRRDTDPRGLRPLLASAVVVGATSDYLVVNTRQALSPGDTITFALDYDSLIAAVTSPFVARNFVSGDAAAEARSFNFAAEAE